jgi:type I restriction enzyme S subunit
MKAKLQLKEDEYKETELGLLPSDWLVITVEKSLNKKRISVGKIKQQKYRKSGKFPIVNQGQKLIAGYWDDQKDVYIDNLPVIIFGDHTRIIKFIDFPFVCGADGTKVLIPNSDFYPKFFYYVLQTLNILSRGYNRHFSLLREKIIPLPPLPEQKRIAYVLSTIQEAKEKTENKINALKEMKKSMMKHLFMYGPVSLEDADKVKLKDTEIGKVPKDWEINNFPDYIDYQEGPGILAKDFVNSGIPLIRIRNIQGNIVNLTNCNYLSIEKVDNKWSHFRLKENDILISCSASTGIVSEVTKESEDTIAYTGIIRLRSKNKTLNQQYLKYFVKSDCYLHQINKIKTGVTIKHYGPSHLKGFKIILPPPNTQQNITSILSMIDLKIQSEENKKHALDELFKSMLRNLMTAKIRVKDIELPVEVENA